MRDPHSHQGVTYVSIHTVYCLFSCCQLQLSSGRLRFQRLTSALSRFRFWLSGQCKYGLNATASEVDAAASLRASLSSMHSPTNRASGISSNISSMLYTCSILASACTNALALPLSIQRLLVWLSTTILVMSLAIFIIFSLALYSRACSRNGLPLEELPNPRDIVAGKCDANLRSAHLR